MVVKGLGPPEPYPRLCQLLSEACKDVTWQNYAWQLIWWPLIVQGFVFWFIYVVVSLLTSFQARGRTPMHLTIDADGFFASRFRKRRTLHVILNLSEIIMSLIFVYIWARRTYTKSVEASERKAEWFMSLFFVGQYVVKVLSSGCHWVTVWSPTCLTTIMTIVPVFAAPNAVDATWVSWSYLRILNVAESYDYLDRECFSESNAMVRRALLSAVRTMAMLLSFGGTVLLLEIYGDPPAVENQRSVIQTDMGNIGTFEIVYYVITTLSTVGYGDFVPTTVASRVFLVLAVFIGLAFFITEVEFLTRMSVEIRPGSGRYSQPIPDIQHVVVLGGEVSNPGSLLRAFNQELFADRYYQPTSLAGTAGNGWPTCSYMAQTGLRKLEAMFKGAPHHVKKLSNVFEGNPLRQYDLDRVDVLDSAITLAVSDADAEDKIQDDHNTIIQALALARFYPLTKFLLCVSLPQSKVKAVRMGFEPKRCLSLYELKCSIMAQSILVKGWSTMLTSLILSTVIDAEDLAIAKQCVQHDRAFEDQQWLREYRYGSAMMFCRFHVKQSFVGRTFNDLAKVAAEHSVVILGAVVNGKLMLNPYKEKLRPGAEIYGITPAEGNLRCLRQEDAIDLDGGIASTGLTRPPDEIWKRADDNDGMNAAASFGHQVDERVQAEHGEAVQDALQKGKQLTQTGGHYVLILLDNHAWSQAAVFLQALQNPSLPSQPPVVVMAPPPGPCEGLANFIFGQCDKRGLVVGSPARLKDVQEVCPKTAVGVAMIAGKQSSEGSRMTDAPGVLAVTTMEGYFASQGVQGPPILLELFDEDSVRLCPRLPKSVKSFMPPQHRYSAEGSGSDMGEPFHYAPRFAGGNIFVASCLGGVIAQSYYMSGIIELVQALSLGFHADDGSAGSGQTSFPWQIRLPAEITAAIDKDERSQQYRHVVELLAAPPWNAVCIGLYRQRFEAVTASACYTALNPPTVTVLRKTDLVTVLADKAFGRHCAEKGLLLLPGSEKSAEKAE